MGTTTNHYSLNKQSRGQNPGTWDTEVNNNFDSIDHHIYNAQTNFIDKLDIDTIPIGATFVNYLGQFKLKTGLDSEVKILQQSDLSLTLKQQDKLRKHELLNDNDNDGLHFHSGNIKFPFLVMDPTGINKPEADNYAIPRFKFEKEVADREKRDSELSTEIAKKANISGDKAQIFQVASPVGDYDAINKAYLMTLIPNTPPSISIESSEFSSITITWQSIPGVAYNIYWEKGSDVTTGTQSFQRGVQGALYTIKGLEPLTEYTIAVSAQNSFGEGNLSNKVTAKTDAGTPSQVRNAKALPSGIKTFNIEWDPSTNATGYLIFLDTIDPPKELNAIEVKGGSTKQTTVTVKENETTYYFVIYAINNNGRSIASDRFSAVSPKGKDSKTFTVSSTVQTFIVPDFITSVDIECWGGGGGAAGNSSVFWTWDSQQDGITPPGSFAEIKKGPGGGSGGYAKTTKQVNPGDQLKIYVGKGGIGGGNLKVANAFANIGGSNNYARYIGESGSNGSFSKVMDSKDSVLCYADFGKGGTPYNGGITGPFQTLSLGSGAGGVGGIANTGLEIISGESGKIDGTGGTNNKPGGTGNNKSETGSTGGNGVDGVVIISYGGI